MESLVWISFSGATQLTFTWSNLKAFGSSSEKWCLVGGGIPTIPSWKIWVRQPWGDHENGILMVNDLNIWLVVEPPIYPYEKWWTNRQLGWWHSQYDGKKKMFQTSKPPTRNILEISSTNTASYIYAYQESLSWLKKGTGVTFAPERGSHSPLNQKGSHSPLNHNTFNVVLNPLGLNLGTRGHLGGLGKL